MVGEALTQLLLVKLWENAASSYEAEWARGSRAVGGLLPAQRGKPALPEEGVRGSLQPTISRTIQEHHGSGYSEANQSPLRKMIFFYACLRKKKKSSLSGQKQPSKPSGGLPATPLDSISSVALANKGYPAEAAPTEPTACCIQSSDCDNTAPHS